MKTTQMATNIRLDAVNKVLRGAKPRMSEGNGRRSPVRASSPLIRWPTEQQILQVSKKLSRITRQGIRRETHGDYFNSGDFAYRINEIIRATDELFKKSQSF